MTGMDGMNGSSDPAGRLAALRHAFDASFALPPPPPHDDMIDLLAVTVGADRVAVPLATMSGLVADRVVTPLPGSPPDLLGVAGLRGHLIPVYDLARVSGHGRAGQADRDTPRWLILAGGSPAFAVAVDRVDGHLRVGPDAIAEPAGHTHGGTGSVVRTTDGPVPVVDMHAVRARVRAFVTAGPHRAVRES
jgi:chemotaxis signal transduction protein